jgi:hypothetical protein
MERFIILWNVRLRLSTCRFTSPLKMLYSVESLPGPGAFPHRACASPAIIRRAAARKEDNPEQTQ